MKLKSFPSNWELCTSPIFAHYIIYKGHVSQCQSFYSSGISSGTDQSSIPRCSPFLSDVNIDAVALEGTSGQLSCHPCGSGCERQCTLELQFPSCRKTGFEMLYAYSYNHEFSTVLPIRGNSLPGSLPLMTAQ